MEWHERTDGEICILQDFIVDKYYKVCDTNALYLALFLAVRTAKEVIPLYAQQLRERVGPDMITLGSLSLQQVSATKRNICVIIPYSPAHQPCPLCCVSVAFANGNIVCTCVCVHLSVVLSVYMYMCVLHTQLTNFLVLFAFAPLFVLNLPPSPNCYLYKSSAFHFYCSWFESQLNAPTHVKLPFVEHAFKVRWLKSTQPKISMDFNYIIYGTCFILTQLNYLFVFEPCCALLCIFVFHRSWFFLGFLHVSVFSRKIERD